MARTVPTGRDHETRELAPAHCPFGHPLGAGRVLVAYEPHPGHVGRARSWTCRQCGAKIWAEPSRI